MSESVQHAGSARHFTTGDVYCMRAVPVTPRQVMFTVCGQCPSLHAEGLNEIWTACTRSASHVFGAAILQFLFLTPPVRKRNVLDCMDTREKSIKYLITALRRIVYGSSRQDHHPAIDIGLLPLFCENLKVVLPKFWTSFVFG